MISSHDFPLLTPANHRVTSPADREYNCIAWSVGDTVHWFQPGVYWPIQTGPDDFGLDALRQLFVSMGYSDCGNDARVEPGFERVALYGGTFLYTHAARQLATGKWTSKLGRSEDIEHDSPDDLSGGAYGHVALIMKRALT